MDFINNGFKPEFIEEEQIYQGLRLGNNVIVNFKKIEDKMYILK